MTDQDHLDRINALTRNARSTWFALLAALVFVGITLIAVQHIDFYDVERATRLPVIGVEVPTREFFIAAPIVIAATYGYFQLYLIRLWDAFGAAPSHLNGVKLGNAVTPWLVTDAALYIRTCCRNDHCTTPRVLEACAMLLNLVLAWAFAIVVLATLWWTSMHARTLWVTGISGLSLFVSIIASVASLTAMITRLRTQNSEENENFLGSAPAMALMIILIPVITSLTYSRTSGSPDRLAPLNLSYYSIVKPPAGWMPLEDALRKFRAEWCGRELSAEQCFNLGIRETVMLEEFDRLRSGVLYDMRSDWSKLEKRLVNLHRADLRDSFLSGANLADVGLEKANLTLAQLEQTNLSRAEMSGADLSQAKLDRANLNYAELNEAILNGARIAGSDLTWAKLKGAVLIGTNIHMTDLSSAQMEGANLFLSQLTGTANERIKPFGLNLKQSANHGGMLRFADLTYAIFDPETDFRNSFLDGSVTLSDAVRLQMGSPCQWAADTLDDEAFFGRWRGWIEAHPDYQVHEAWSLVAPEKFRDITAIPPEPGCFWKTGPMPGTHIE